MSSLSIVLVSPQGDANIGASARAMKNFGYTDLRLVNPTDFRTAESYSWAVDARDIIDNAKVYKSLGEALSDMSSTIALTRRLGRARKQEGNIIDKAPRIADLMNKGKVAVIFGQEDAGLSNDEIALADIIVSIPTSGALPSLNLAQAVLITCYEISKQSLDPEQTPGFSPGCAEWIDLSQCNTDRETTQKSPYNEWRYATRNELMKVTQNLDRTLTSLGYADTPGHPLKTKIINQFNRLLGRAGLTDRDIRMLSGLLPRIRKMAKSD